FLEQGERGRALIYPLDGVRVTPPVNLIRERGLLGVASRSVRCDNRFRPLVDMLLGRPIIVEDVSVALRVIKRGLGSVVTLDGFLLRPNGGISGGFSRTSGDAFVRQRELDELPEHIAALAQRKATLDYRIERERESLENSSNAL